MVTVMSIQDVEFMNDLYITADGSALGLDPTRRPFGFSASASLDSYAATPIDCGTGTGSPPG